MIGRSVGEQPVEVVVRQTVRMLFARLQRHQIDHVDDAYAHVGHVFPQQLHRRQRFECGHVAGARHHHVGLDARVVARPLPDADAGGTLLARLVHRQPLQLRLFARDDHVDAVAAPQAFVDHPQQGVRVRRQVHADHARLLVRDVIDETRVLVRKAVVVLPPHVRGQQVVQRRDRTGATESPR